MKMYKPITETINKYGEKKGIEPFINQIILGDVLEVMKNMPPEFVDVAFADPPFNLRKEYGNYEDSKADYEYLEWCYKWIDEMIRVLKPNGTLFLHNIPKWLIEYGHHLRKQGMIFRHWIAWDAMSIPLGKTLLPAHYGILYYTKSKRDFKFYDLRAPHKRCSKCGEVTKDYGGKKNLMHPFGTILSDVWTDLHRIRHKKRRDEHPCQLPEPLLERLILMVTNRNDIVLDPFIGTGTTALAAKRLNRKFIGIDNDKNYVELTRKKLDEISPREYNGYVYQYNKKGQSKKSPNNKFGRFHSLLDKDIVIDKNKLKNETPGLYVDYELELIKKDKFYSSKKNHNLEKINN